MGKKLKEIRQIIIFFLNKNSNGNRTFWRKSEEIINKNYCKKFTNQNLKKKLQKNWKKSEFTKNGNICNNKQRKQKIRI